MRARRAGNLADSMGKTFTVFIAFIDLISLIKEKINWEEFF